MTDVQRARYGEILRSWQAAAHLLYTPAILHGRKPPQDVMQRQFETAGRMVAESGAA
jgi:hypothetical protein